MTSRLSTAGLAGMCACRTFATWIVVLALSVVAASGLGDALTFEGRFTNRPESVRADDHLRQRLRGSADQPLTETVIVQSNSVTAADAAFQEVVERTSADQLAGMDVLRTRMTRAALVSASLLILSTVGMAGLATCSRSSYRIATISCQDRG